jgi:hypothetical protein
MNPRRSYYAARYLDGDHLGAPAGESVINYDGAAWQPLTGVLASGAAITFSYTPDHRAVLAIFNGRGSEAVVRIDEIRVLPLCGKGSLTALTTVAPVLRIARLTALTGGEAISVSKLDTASPDVPPEVYARANPAGFTVSSTIFWKMDAPLWTRTMAFPVHLASRHSSASQWSGAAALIAGYAQPNCQRVTLREGEGIAVATLGFGFDFSLNRPLAITIVFRTQAGHCYIVSRPLSSAAGAGNETGAYPFFSLFNGVGSGLVLEVVGITLQEIRDAQEVPSYTLEFIEGLVGGEDVSVTPADSAYPQLPSDVVVRRDALIRPVGISRGAAIVGNVRRCLPAIIGAGPQFTGYGVMPLSMRAPSLAAVYSNPSALVEPIRIREGEGVALVLKNGSASGLFEAGITFSLESAQELSRSETIYVS